MRFDTFVMLPLTALRWFFFRFFSFIKNRQSGLPYTELDRLEILVFPSFKKDHGFDELIRKISFAFPENDNISFHLIVSETLLTQAKAYMQNLAASESHHLQPLKIYSIRRIERIKLAQYDMILCHKAIALPRIIRYFFKTEIIDSHFYSHVESIALQRSWFHLLDEGRKNHYKETSENNFLKLSSRLSGRSHSCCFLTGPSMSNFKSFKIPPDSVRIICNSLVKNDEFLNYIDGADIITFADPVFHFGASDYAIRFRQKMVEVALKWDSYILVPDYTMPLLIAWFPHLKSHLIGLKTLEGCFHFPTFNELWVKATDNIFTMFMLPIAATLSDNIFVAGSDGRESKGRYFWGFNPQSQFMEHIDSLKEYHPSFFRDRRYNKYYEKHCRLVEELISYAETFGKSFVSITPSNIPALHKRRIDRYNQ